MNKTKLYSLKSEKINIESVKIGSSKDSYKFAKNFYGDDIEIYESFFIILLNRANKAHAYAKISQGGIIGTVVDIKIIAKYCVDSLSSSVILCHNHPSGNIKPSQPDRDITQKTKEALQLLDVNVLDHIIISKEAYYSFADNGEI